MSDGLGWHFSTGAGASDRAARRALDALQHPGRGTIVSRVLDGKVLWVADATRVLHECAVWCAERALTREREAGREPDPRSWRALEAKRAWLRGEATHEELAAARADAWAAVQAAERAAMPAAMVVAARAAVEAAERDAVEAAEWAAWWAAGAAAWAAERDAVEAAERAAAWDAERDVQHVELERRLLALAPATAARLAAPPLCSEADDA